MKCVFRVFLSLCWRWLFPLPVLSDRWLNTTQNPFLLHCKVKIKWNYWQIKGLCCRIIEWVSWKDVWLILWIVFSHLQILADRAIETVEMGSKFWQRDRNCYFWNGPFTMFNVHLKQFRPTNGNVVNVCFPTLNLTVNHKKGPLVQTKCYPAPCLVFDSIISRNLGRGCNTGQSFQSITSIREICEICSSRTS